MNPLFTLGALFVVSAVSLHCVAAEPDRSSHQFRAQPPANRIYVFTGLSATKLDGESADWALPLELRYVTPKNFELGLRSSAVHGSSVSSSSIDSTGTTFTVKQGCRLECGFDFASVEAGYIADRKGRLGPEGDAYFVAVRAQGGYTRSGFDASIALYEFHEASTPENAAAYSLGYLYRFVRWQAGINVVAEDFARREDLDRKSANLIVSRRQSSGDAWYGIIEKRLSDVHDDWYAAVGYEFRFDLR